MAAKKYGLDPIPHGNDLSYGCSIDCTTVPLVYDVFKIEEVSYTQDPCFKAENERMKQMLEAKGDKMCLLKIILPKGMSSLTQVKHGTLCGQNENIWEGNSDSQEFLGINPRKPGVDKDGVPLQPIVDQIDVIINEFSQAEVRVGPHYRWGYCEGRNEGQVTVVEEIERMVKSLFDKFGDSALKIKRNAGKRKKGTKHR